MANVNRINKHSNRKEIIIYTCGNACIACLASTYGTFVPQEIIRYILLPGCVNAQNHWDLHEVLTDFFPLFIYFPYIIYCLTIPAMRLCLSVTLDCLVGPLDAEVRVSLRFSNDVESPANQHLFINRSSFGPCTRPSTTAKNYVSHRKKAS